MDNDTKNLIAIIVSGYAAVISTITLIWNIVNTIIDKLSIIEIKSSTFISAFTVVESNESIIGAEVLCISIVNSSKKVKYINRPKFKLSYKAILGNEELDEVNLINLQKKETWPIALKPEEEIVLNYPLRDGTEWFLTDESKNATFKVMVKDTINKTYYSKKLKVKLIKNIVSHNKGINQEYYELSCKQY